MKYYFTFGSGHHDTRGRSLMGYYVVIEAKNEPDARTGMFALFGEKWSFCYNEERFAGQGERFGLEELWPQSVDLCCGIEQSEYLKLKAKLDG